MPDVSDKLHYHQMLVSEELGGAGLIALQVAADVKKRGYPSHVWVPGPGPAEVEAKRLGLIVHRFEADGALSNSRTRTARCNWRLARRLRRLTPGLIHVHSPYHYGALHWALRVSGLVRVAHVQIEADQDGLCWSVRRPPELIVTCAHFLVDVVRNCLPVSRRNEQRIAAVSNAVDTDRFFPSDKAAAKATVGAPPSLPLALMLANLAPHKGQETAIRSVARLKRRGIEMTCWLAGLERGGATTYTSRLMNLIHDLDVADRVRLLGQRSDAPDLLRAADFFLLPSTNEGLPLSIVEAQATKVPVLAAPTAGIPEVVVDGQTGFLIPANDSAGYATCMETLLAHPEARRNIAETAYAKIVREYSMRSYCDRMWGLYEEALRRHAPARSQWFSGFPRIAAIQLSSGNSAR